MRRKGHRPEVPGGRAIHTRSEVEGVLPPLRQPRSEKAQSPNALFLVSTDLRRQLEGGIETLELAHARYVLLEEALCEKHWQEAVQERWDSLGELIRQEPECEEALARLLHRAKVERWPEMEPAHALVRELELLRTRLEALTRRRLCMPAWSTARLGEVLARLHQLLARTLAPPVSSEELLLHQGAFKLDTTATLLLLPLLCFLPMLLVFCTGFVASGGLWLTLSQLACSLMIPFLPFVCQMLQRHLSGRFWLTQKRLVWQPTGRDAIHIPLHAICPGGIHLRFTGSVEVRLVDGRQLRLDFIRGEKQLVALLERYGPSSRPVAARAGTRPSARGLRQPRSEVCSRRRHQGRHTP